MGGPDECNCSTQRESEFIPDHHHPARLVCVLEVPISFLDSKRALTLPKSVHTSIVGVVHEREHVSVCRM